MNMHLSFFRVALVLALMAAFACNGENDYGTRSTDRSTPKGTPSSTVPDFLVLASQGNWAEVQSGKMALTKASDPEVKDFARRMVEDHNRVKEELNVLADRKGVRLPYGMDEAHQKELESLSVQTGGEFDRKYMTMMVSDHDAAVSLFERNAKETKDSDIRAFAEKALPTLREHLKMAREISGNLTAD